ncbi:MAG: beta-galactosidase, partial [Chloroflexota bacterium]
MIDRRDTFQLGVCHYPEHWPRDRWERYASQLRGLGIAYARIAEFAWSRMEPRPGDYDWGWLDDAIEVLHAAGLKVILCTPTATPPAWLVRAQPCATGGKARRRPGSFRIRRNGGCAECQSGI